jgi:hypothetical protein
LPILSAQRWLTYDDRAVPDDGTCFVLNLHGRGWQPVVTKRFPDQRHLERLYRSIQAWGELTDNEFRLPAAPPPGGGGDR